MTRLLTGATTLYHKKPGTFFWILAVLFILPVSLAKVYDIDIWWHMQCGRSILENFAWPDFSEYYFSPVTQSTRGLRYTWLGDILFHLVYSFSGDTGLQMLRLGFVIGACVMLRSLAGANYRGWQLALIMLVVVGTYQKQIIRNSMFALVLVPLLFWIWHLVRNRNREKLVWLYPPVLGLWSCLHGSYLLGFSLVVLILFGDLLDRLRKLDRLSLDRILSHGAVLLLSFGLIALWNPTTMSFFNVSRILSSFGVEQVVETPKVKAENTVTLPGEKEALYPELMIKESDFVYTGKKLTGPLGAVKHWLNNTIFKSSGTASKSADFVSPFDKLDRFYVIVSLLSGVIGLFFVCFLIRPVRFSTLLPFVAVLIAGLGYLRLVGYIPLMTAAAIFQASGSRELKPWFELKGGDVSAWCFSLIMILVLWINCLLGFPFKVGTLNHVFGFGRIPVYSGSCPDAVLFNYRDNPVFTTMSTGGYLLYRWFPDKKVFADGFFAPHAKNVMLHLRLMREKGINPDFLHAEYGIGLALVDHSSGSVLNTFFNSENWHVRYIDTGMVCFVFEPDYFSDIPRPEVLFDSRSFNVLPRHFRQLAANSLHTVVNSIFKKGRIKDGLKFMEQNHGILDETRGLIDPNFLEVTRLLALNGESVYGRTNTKAQYYEYRHNAAIEAKDTDGAVKYGLKLLELAPDRLPVVLNLAIAYLRMKKPDLCLEMLEKIENAPVKGPNSFFAKNRNNISKFYWALSNLAKSDLDYFKAYALAEHAHRVDPKLISKEKLYQAAMENVTLLNQADRKKEALLLLSGMESLFAESGRWLNDMAWQILISGENTPRELESALVYGQRAVTAMEQGSSGLLDLVYDTLAVIYFRQGKAGQACDYLNQAFRIAPDHRKSGYKNRPECGDSNIGHIPTPAG